MPNLSTLYWKQFISVCVFLVHAQGMWCYVGIVACRVNANSFYFCIVFSSFLFLSHMVGKIPLKG